MKNSHLIPTILVSFMIFVSCGNRNPKAESEASEIADTSKVNNGIPLDNLHRSRTTDTLPEKENKTQGVPLDNLVRDKDTN